MKNKSYLSLFTLLMIISVLFYQCQKGDAGPAGSTGPAGANGATGAAGAQGPKGDTGTANVIYSAWLDVVYAPDTVHIGTLVDTVGFFANITAPKLTAAILNSGEMKVYFNFGSTASADVVPLPFFDVYSDLSIAPDFLLQRIFLYSNANASTVTQAGVKRFQYRYILIPGSVPSGRVMQTVDWNNYNQVKAYLGLKD